MKTLDPIRSAVRKLFRSVAHGLDRVSGGRITPNQVTVVSTLLHGFVAYWIVTNNLILAGLGLIVFGLMDTLDGELSRLQGRSTNFGVVLDAVADRLKEVIIYGAIVYYFVGLQNEFAATLTAITLGISLCVTFTKAKGEAVLGAVKHGQSAAELNRLFGSDSLMKFEIRMSLLVLGMLFGWLTPVMSIIAVFSIASLYGRLVEIKHALS